MTVQLVIFIFWSPTHFQKYLKEKKTFKEHSTGWTVEVYTCHTAWAAGDSMTSRPTLTGQPPRVGPLAAQLGETGPFRGVSLLF